MRLLRRAVERLGRSLAAGARRELRAPAAPLDRRLERVEAGLAAVREQLAGQARNAHVLAALERLNRTVAGPAVDLLDLRHATADPPGRHCTNLGSQNFEDAILADIFARIGAGDRTFLEIGVGDGRENNTRLLLELGWRGAWIESDPAALDAIAQRFAEPLASGRLRLVGQAITVANAAELVAAAGVGAAVDLLSVDVDMNTSHIWRALPVSARVACVEYNASVPPQLEYEVAYAPDGVWDFSNRFGASLKTLERIGAAKDMALIGCDPMGVNAFFVARELAERHFPGRHDAETHFEPPRYHLGGSRGHPRG